MGSDECILYIGNIEIPISNTRFDLKNLVLNFEVDTSYHKILLEPFNGCKRKLRCYLTTPKTTFELINCILYSYLEGNSEGKTIGNGIILSDYCINIDDL